jgi:hypothetical protein
LLPQISEHCPVNIPSRFEKMKVWLIRPGSASTFLPMEGIVQEWITSEDVIRIRMVSWAGRFKVSLVFISRIMFEFSRKFSVSVWVLVGCS